MKKFFLTAAFSLFAAIVISCGNGNAATDGIVKGNKSKMDTLSYVIGMDMANGLARDLGNLKFDFESLKKAVEEGALKDSPYKCGDSLLTRESTTAILNDFFMRKYGQRVQKIRANERAAADTTGTMKPEELDFNPETLFASDEERALISSAFGYDIGLNLRKNTFPLQLVWLFQGIDDVHNSKAIMSEQQAGDYIRNYFTVVVPAQNKKASQEWLAGIEKKSGVKKTESGLLYKIEAEGDVATKPSAEDVVKVHYKGTTRKGNVFDASRFADMPAERQQMMKQYKPDTYMNDEPVEFPLNRVIKGWTEGLQLIGKGGKMTLWIPSELAYGERGAGQNIAPNEALCFEVELVDVTKSAPAAAETAPAE